MDRVCMLEWGSAWSAYNGDGIRWSPSFLAGMGMGLARATIACTRADHDGRDHSVALMRLAIAACPHEEAVGILECILDSGAVLDAQRLRVFTAIVDGRASCKAFASWLVRADTRKLQEAMWDNVSRLIAWGSAFGALEEVRRLERIVGAWRALDLPPLMLAHHDMPVLHYTRNYWKAACVIEGGVLDAQSVILASPDHTHAGWTEVLHDPPAAAAAWWRLHAIVRPARVATNPWADCLHMLGVVGAPDAVVTPCALEALARAAAERRAAGSWENEVIAYLRARRAVIAADLPATPADVTPQLRSFAPQPRDAAAPFHDAVTRAVNWWWMIDGVTKEDAIAATEAIARGAAAWVSWHKRAALIQLRATLRARGPALAHEDERNGDGA